MKFFLDNNISPTFADALKILAEKHGYEVVALRDKFAKDTPDLVWIDALAKESDWTVISADHFKKSKGLERLAIQKAGLKVFVLSTAWAKHQYWDKAYRLVKSFPDIAEQTHKVSGGSVQWVPYSGTKFKRIS